MKTRVLPLVVLVSVLLGCKKDDQTAAPESGNGGGNSIVLSTAFEFVTDSFCVRAPNIITPNGDGLNDIFTVMVKGNLSSLGLAIRNAQGQLVFQSDSATWYWNGIDHHVNDSIPTAGVFQYHLEVTSTTGLHITTDNSFFVAPDTAANCISPLVEPVFGDSFNVDDCALWPSGDRICVTE